MGVHKFFRDMVFPDFKKIDAYDPHFTGLHMMGRRMEPRPQRGDPNFSPFNILDVGPHQQVFNERKQMNAMHTLPAAMKIGPRPDGRA